MRVLANMRVSWEIYCLHKGVYVFAAGISLPLRGVHSIKNPIFEITDLMLVNVIPI